MSEGPKTVLVQVTFSVSWKQVDFVNGEFPPTEELLRDSELYVRECLLSEDWRGSVENFKSFLSKEGTNGTTSQAEDGV